MDWRPLILVMGCTFAVVGCGGDGGSESGAMDKASDAGVARASQPEGRRGNFGGAPTMWIESGGNSVWMQNLSTCWGNGCADTVGSSCTGPGSETTPEITVRPGDRVWLHATGKEELRASGARIEPLDPAGSAVDLDLAQDGAGVWRFAAPDADGVLTLQLRPAGRGGDAGFGACLRAKGEPTGESTVISTDGSVQSSAEAELRFRIDVTGARPGSIRCHPSDRVWRCDALLTGPGSGSGRRMQAVVGAWSRALSAVVHTRVQVLSANDARSASDERHAAISGYLMEVADGRFEICAAGYVSIPPGCGTGNVQVEGINPSEWRLDEASGRHFSREELVVFGRLDAGVLTVDG